MPILGVSPCLCSASTFALQRHNSIQIFNNRMFGFLKIVLALYLTTDFYLGDP